MLELHGWLSEQKKTFTKKSIIFRAMVYTGLGLTSFVAFTLPILAQTDRANSLTPQIITPTLRSPSPQLPTQTPAPLPSPDELLNPSREPVTPQKEVPVTGTITVNRFEVLGSTVFTKAEIDQILSPFTKRPITFSELLKARSQVTDLYISRGYITSGAFIPTQNLQNGVVQIQVIEGGLEDIKVTGVERLSPDYVRSRMNIATGAPLNRDRLIQALQVLQINPLIASISAELSAGTRAGQNILEVRLKEAKSLEVQLSLDNNRAPSVGSLRRKVQISEANLTGLGDTLNIAYSNTDGSNSYDLSYMLPINPYNGSIAFAFNNGNSNVLEKPFNILDIYANSTSYDLTFRQPIEQTPSQEIAIGFTASYRESLTSLLKIPFPLSAGADDNGVTKTTVLRAFQEFTQRSSQSVISLRSQFSLGLGGVLGSNLNTTFPDSRFVSWRGQSQYVNLLAPDTFLLLRGDLQFGDRALLPSEQIGFGGQDTLRGYRQDVLLGDNGLNLSAEMRVPILRVPEWEGLLQLVPFIDAAAVWTSSGGANSSSNTLLGTGLGLRWRIGNTLDVRLDYGIPLISVPNSRNTAQENGLYFNLNFTGF
ncbi:MULTISPECIES: ShlB/FhaC/HecB family hemolysin secretion/activation protein [Pseudanabaena]|uniref:ShlB/FhaC/HecB family hemolysin secretion/activation protein n=1 Tax=Pseudanabaena TaxID=1152 RepID=UPI002479C1A8|nr:MULTISPECIES: ShlB/FhaC/HecB family hemolysin secretion/activation protein [Pseudanabaena]MEA5489844.1 ShlB/FhaC/HecB family hemolysin secretion/activation protein [Pseudanabaena sp. CCNP1317]WGS74133.1 ShlB/FhaC/HecB family hemolysin secretion/activation protein [Pseudanabaena galeata CCNP1313]